MIVKMTHATMEDYNKPNEAFSVTGRILLRYESGVWTYTEETLAEPYMKRYADEVLDAAYIEEDGKAVFLYYDAARYGFIIGGVDNMLYSNFPAAAEQAIFWYYKF